MYIVKINGSATPNPGMRTIEIIVSEKNNIIDEISKDMGSGTCHEAEYLALIEGLKLAIACELTDSDIVFQSDNQLVVFQVNGMYQVSKDTLKPLNTEARELLSNFQSARVEWVPKKRIFKATVIKDLEYMEPPASCA
ncbi:MAG: Ribonuclease HI [Candidatus Methanofastidiosum methylothiophilum]|uniref:Ribonuclease HI n=1 Tax=Candidatus Methanofastidiosum methylothiophilum TaxID=1705564 RepID=A0A150IZ89_9EURY|nr:MAG: Ribonuclease HI [Candidatus Methanofastidiosum methylthiophilus]OPY25533.1 MAG: Ribonuclease HI [Methanomethylovorans sp. PtaU1.Bin073]